MKKLFAIMSALLIALVLVGCGAKTEAPTKAPATTAKPTEIVTTLTPEERKDLSEKNKGELAQAFDQALVSSTGTKLSLEFALELQAEVSMENLITDECKAKAQELNEDESFEQSAKVDVHFTFEFEIDTEALTAALQTKFYVKEFNADIKDADAEDIEQIQSLFFNEDGSYKEFTLYVYYANKVINLGLNAPVKDGIYTIVAAIVTAFGGNPASAMASVNEILPYDENHFVFDLVEYVKPEDNPEGDADIDALNDAKAAFASKLDYVLGKIKGQSVSSAYSALKTMGTQYGLITDDDIDMDMLFALISMMTSSESDYDYDDDFLLEEPLDGEEEEFDDDDTEVEEEYDEMYLMVMDYIASHLVIDKDGDDFVMSVEEADYLTETFDDEEKTPIISLFDVDTDMFSEIKASLEANLNFTGVQFDGFVVELKAHLLGSDIYHVDVEVDAEEESEEESEEEKVDLEYNMSFDGSLSFKFSLNVSTTLSLKYEELVPTFSEESEEQILDLLENPGVRNEVDDFMLENFGPKLK